MNGEGEGGGVIIYNDVNFANNSLDVSPKKEGGGGKSGCNKIVMVAKIQNKNWNFTLGIIMHNYSNVTLKGGENSIKH